MSLLTPAEAANLLGVSVSSLRRYASEGRVDCTRTPRGHRRYRREDIEALIPQPPALGALPHGVSLGESHGPTSRI